jgi:hypothetical protein
MQTPKKKLFLDRQTIKTLNGVVLDQVVGGSFRNNTTVCPTNGCG